MNTTNNSWQDSDQLLDQLLQEVQTWEGTLGAQGDRQLGLGATAITNLLQSKVTLGSPYHKLTKLTEETFSEITGIDLNPLYKNLMKDRYDFYYLSLTVGLIPAPAVEFWRLICQLNFGPPGNQEPIIESIFPNQKWREVLSCGVGMDIGLDENLNWSAGIDSSSLNAILPQIPGEIQTKISSKNNFNGYIVMPAYKYNFGHFEIVASGEGSPEANWRIDDQKLKKTGNVEFIVVFKVPQTNPKIQSIKLSAQAWAEPNINWLYANIKYVVAQLSDDLKKLFKIQQQQETANRLARSDSRDWDLQLPN